MMNIIIKQETAADYEDVKQVIKAAFANAEHSDKNEHKLVARLRDSDEYISELSLVAVDKDRNHIVGHILLSKIKIIHDNYAVESLALAPIAVLPEYQHKGIGKRLISEALKIATAIGFKSVVVLGHPDYYPKFGFEKASKWGIKAPFEVPNEAFMAVELKEGALKNASGVVEYPSVFFE